MSSADSTRAESARRTENETVAFTLEVNMAAIEGPDGCNLVVFDTDFAVHWFTGFSAMLRPRQATLIPEVAKEAYEFLDALWHRARAMEDESAIMFFMWDGPIFYKFSHDGEPRCVKGDTPHRRIANVFNLALAKIKRFDLAITGDQLKGPDMQQAPYFTYSYGSGNSRDASFSLVSVEVDISKPPASGRLLKLGPIGKRFPPAISDLGNRASYTLFGKYGLGWAKHINGRAIHFRLQTVRTGYAAIISEVTILLDTEGPKFKLEGYIPSCEAFPTNEIVIFEGRGWIMDDTMLTEHGVTRYDEVTQFWPGKDDGSLFTYTKLDDLPHKRKPEVKRVTTKDGEQINVLVRDNQPRRRLRIRKRPQ